MSGRNVAGKGAERAHHKWIAQAQGSKGDLFGRLTNHGRSATSQVPMVTHWKSGCTYAILVELRSATLKIVRFQADALVLCVD